MKSIKVSVGLVALLASSVLNAQGLSVRAPSAPVAVDAVTSFARGEAIARSSGLSMPEQKVLAEALSAKTKALLEKGGVTPEVFSREISKTISETLGDKAAQVEANVTTAGVLTLNPLSAFTPSGAADASLRQCELRGVATSSTASVLDTASGIANSQALAVEMGNLLKNVDASNAALCKGSTSCAAFADSRTALIKSAVGRDVQLARGMSVVQGILLSNVNSGMSPFEAKIEAAKKVCEIANAKVCSADEARDLEDCIL